MPKSKFICNADIKVDTKAERTKTLENVAYAIAKKEAKVIDGYVRLHIRRKPWYLPDFVYSKIMRRMVSLDRFVLVKKEK